MCSQWRAHCGHESGKQRRICKSTLIPDEYCDDDQTLRCNFSIALRPAASCHLPEQDCGRESLCLS